MKIDEIELEINISDNSVKEFSDELIEQLTILRFGMIDEAMSDRQLFLEGRMDMLDSIIKYIKIIK